MIAEPTLLSPLAVRGLELSNRLVMPPMANNRATLAGDVTDAITEHYTARCRGLGLMIVEHAYVTPAGRLNPNQLGIQEEGNVPGLARLAAALRDCGVPAALQITHAGGKTTAEACGVQPEAPSPVAPPRATETPRELTTADLAALRRAFADAARRAKRAGFAAVELHGAHGYLLNQFCSPLTNHRSDGYGGDPAARLRFPLEVVAAVRGAVGPDYPLLYRLGADDLIPGGLTIEDAVYAARELAAAGVDLVDVSGGLGGASPPGSAGREGYFDYLSGPVKEAVAVPVMVTGGVVTASGADRLVREGLADLVGVGRALLEEPDWAERAVAELTAAGP